MENKQLAVAIGVGIFVSFVGILVVGLIFLKEKPSWIIDPDAREKSSKDLTTDDINWKVAAPVAIGIGIAVAAAFMLYKKHARTSSGSFKASALYSY